MRYFNLNSDLGRICHKKTAKAAPWPYGYWIKPDGEKIDVGMQQHLAKYLEAIKSSKFENLTDEHDGGMNADEVNKIYAEANNKGWVRVINPQLNGYGSSYKLFRIYIDAISLTSAQLSTLLRIMQDQQEYAKAYNAIFDARINDNREMLFAESLRYLRSMVQDKKPQIVDKKPNQSWYGRAKVSSASAKEPYGYWLTPDGTLSEVEFEQHLNFLKDNTKMSTYGEAHDAGYVRIVGPYESNYMLHIGIQLPSLKKCITLEQYNKLESLISSTSLQARRDPKILAVLINIEDQNYKSISNFGVSAFEALKKLQKMIITKKVNKTQVDTVNTEKKNPTNKESN